MDSESHENRTFSRCENGTLYEGGFLDGLREGPGIVYYCNGDIYVGDFKKGKMSGSGTYFFSSGEYFVGNFEDSNMSDGILYQNGKEIKIEFRGHHIVTAVDADVDKFVQQKHSMLFSTTVKHVHEHFKQYSKMLSISVDHDDDIAFPEESAGNFRFVKKNFSPTSNMLFESTWTPDRKKTSEVGKNIEFGAPPVGVHSRVHLSLEDAETESENLRDALTRGSSAGTILSCAGPAHTEEFWLVLFAQRVLAFLFPFLALPWVPFSPLRIQSLSQEREFVVSGATLRQDFEPPRDSLIILLGAVCLQVASIVIVACKVKLGKVQDGAITLPEMVIPCVLWFFVALFSGTYNSFIQKPHSLERMDRNLTPKLSAYAASVVDSRSKVCITTWDEEGRSKVRNKHYRLRWLFYSVVYGAMMGLSAPSTRGGFGFNMFGKTEFEKAASLCSFFSTFLFSCVLTYNILKLTDMERETNAKLRVLTEIAFIDQRSIVNPSLRVRQPFQFDAPFDPTDLFNGFGGWLITRSIVVYASAFANHRARNAAMGIFVVCMLILFIFTMSDVFYMLANHYTQSADYYSTAHSYGVFAVLFWGILLIRYVSACVGSKFEFKRHLYLMDVAALFHNVEKHNFEGSSIISKCRLMASEHDAVPNVFGVSYYPLVLVVLLVFNIVALAAIGFQLGEVIYY